MSKPKYHCTQDELYEICRLAWQSCLDFLLRFTGLKPIYTLLYVNGKIAAIDAAENLPDDQARGAGHEVERAGMVTQANKCLEKWLQLKRYIITAYTDPVVQKARLEEAGSKDYEQAAAENWEKLKGMLLSGRNFITNHTVELSANNNMPAGFPADYNAERTIFLPLLTSFLNEEETAQEGTPVKIDANNGIYDDLTMVNGDGQFLFRKEPEIQEEFIFERQKALVSSPGSAGLNFTAVEDVTFIALVGVTASMQQAGKPAVVLQTDAKGKCLFNILEVGTYTLTVTLASYVTQILTVKIKTGVVSRRKVMVARV